MALCAKKQSQKVGMVYSTKGWASEDRDLTTKTKWNISCDKKNKTATEELQKAKNARISTTVKDGQNYKLSSPANLFKQLGGPKGLSAP